MVGALGVAASRQRWPSSRRSGSERLLISHDGATVAVEAPPDVLKGLGRFFENHYDVTATADDSLPATWRLNGLLTPSTARPPQINPGWFLLPAPLHRRDGQQSVYVRPSLGMEITVRPGSCSVDVRSPYVEEIELQVRLLIRDQLLTPRLTGAGQVMMHASAVERGGAVTAFLGAKAAGKTTGLLSMMFARRHNLVASDRMLLTAASGRLCATGLPERCNVSTAAFGVGEPLLPLQSWSRGEPAYNDKILVGAEQLAGCAGVGVKRGAALTALIFPQVDEAAPFTVAPVCRFADLRPHLIENILEGGVYDRYPNWLLLAPPPAAPPAVRLDAICATSSSTIRALRVTGPFREYRAWIESGRAEADLAGSPALGWAA